MAIQVLKCENCGAKLERNNKGELFCPSCGFSYAEKDEINNTYITHRESIVKNFYGSSDKQELDEETIKGYELRIIDAFKQNNLPEARNYCLSIILKSPNNKRAVTTKCFIENVLRTADGRYKTINISAVFTFINYLCDDSDINSYIEIFDLAQALMESTSTYPSKEVLGLCDKAKLKVSALNNPYTNQFLNSLQNFRNRMNEECQRQAEKEKQCLERQRTEEQQRQERIAAEGKRKHRIIVIGIGVIVVIIVLITIIANV